MTEELKTIPLVAGAGYFGAVYNPAAMSESAAMTLADIDYDTMVGTGLSGALAIPRLADALDKHWMIVRKPGENSHSGDVAEGKLGKRWVFVDDFISSGSTFSRVLSTIKNLTKARHWETHYVGAYLYQHGTWFQAGTEGVYPEALEPELYDLMTQREQELQAARLDRLDWLTSPTALPPRGEK